MNTYFGSIELGSVYDRKSKKSFTTLRIEGQNVEVKADTDAEATVIPYDLYKKITKKPLQKIQQPFNVLAVWAVYAFKINTRIVKCTFCTLLLTGTLHPYCDVMPAWI